MIGACSCAECASAQVPLVPSCAAWEQPQAAGLAPSNALRGRRKLCCDCPWALLFLHGGFLPVLVRHLAKHSFALWNQWLAFNPAKKILWDAWAAQAALEGSSFTGCTFPRSWYFKFTYIYIYIYAVYYFVFSLPQKMKRGKYFYSLKWIAFSE